ncbi:sensor histidine kinase [Catellatospora vulcania]|uniref:sensor histidine kinase n=1 Tax=Catellatospora vulcania TaxID=1460450 RepID=UPI001E644EA9|nr:HAMP domain-containing sensor histidine kinase [Catellatospora vulcania]
MTRLTIRARLTLVYGGLFLLAGVLLLAATYAMVAQRPGGQVGHTVSGPQAGVGDPGPQPIPPTAAPADGGVLTTSYQVAEDTWDDALDALLTRGAIALAAVGALTIALGWLLAGRMLQPLHRVTETARRIAESPAADRGLHERIALAGPPDEVKQLADTFDVMLARLDQAFDGQRRFIANASHELRTPLTVNRSLLEVALYRGEVTPQLAHLGRHLLEMNTRQERLLDGLLLLARSEREVTDRAYVDLADIVEHVTDTTDPGTVSVTAQAGEAPTTGNPALLERLVQNLVDNGVRHNVPAGGRLLVSTASRADGTVELRVANTGPVIPRYEVPGLFEPFHRYGGDRIAAPGAGLGLSIVRAVARAHGGDVRAVPGEGGGLVVTVTLPAADGPGGTPEAAGRDAVAAVSR